MLFAVPQDEIEKQQDLQRKMALHGTFDPDHKDKVVNLFTSDILALCFTRESGRVLSGDLSLNQIATRLHGTPYQSFSDWLTAERIDGSGQNLSGLAFSGLAFCKYTVNGVMSALRLSEAVVDYLTEASEAMVHFVERREREIQNGRAKRAKRHDLTQHHREEMESREEALVAKAWRRPATTALLTRQAGAPQRKEHLPAPPSRQHAARPGTSEAWSELCSGHRRANSVLKTFDTASGLAMPSIRTMCGEFPPTIPPFQRADTPPGMPNSDDCQDLVSGALENVATRRQYYEIEDFLGDVPSKALQLSYPNPNPNPNWMSLPRPSN